MRKAESCRDSPTKISMKEKRSNKRQQTSIQEKCALRLLHAFSSCGFSGSRRFRRVCTSLCTGADQLQGSLNSACDSRKFRSWKISHFCLNRRELPSLFAALPVNYVGEPAFDKAMPLREPSAIRKFSSTLDVLHRPSESSH